MGVFKMKKDENLSCIWGVIFCILAFLFLFFAAVLQGYGQSVTRQGNTFNQNPPKQHVEDTTTLKKTFKITKDKPVLTKYTYKTTRGETYPIYMSTAGRCFIIRTSSRSGKQYRQYLPEVTKQLSGK